MHTPFRKLVRKAHAWLHHAERLLAEGANNVWQGMSKEVCYDVVQSSFRSPAIMRQRDQFSEVAFAYAHAVIACSYVSVSIALIAASVLHDPVQPAPVAQLWSSHA